MSWFGGGKKSDKARKKQIQSLEAKDGKSYKLYKMGRNHYRVTFRCKGCPEALAIQIYLSDNFPEKVPRICIDRKYSHHLLDDNGVVTKLDELQKWSVHSDLGNIIQKITNLFNVSAPTIKRNFPSQHLGGGGAGPMNGAKSQPWGAGGGPPAYDDHINRAQSSPARNSAVNGGPGGYGHGAAPPYGQNPNAGMNQAHSMHGYPGQGGGGGGGYQNNYGGGNSYNSNNSHNRNHSHNQNDIDMGNRRQSQHQSQHQPQSPTADLANLKLSPPSVIPGFAAKTLTELLELDKEPKLIEELAYQVATTLREMKKEAQNGCMQTAQKNLVANESITDLVKKNDELRSNVETLTELYKNLKKREETVLQKFSIPNILQQIDLDLDKIDEESEELKDKFESGDITYVIYAKKLALLRGGYHVLAIKKEKLSIRSGHF